MTELWTRPWSLVDLQRRHRQALEGVAVTVSPANCSSLWVYAPSGGRVIVDGKADTAEPVVGFTIGDSTRVLVQLPLPLRRMPGTEILGGAGPVLVTWPDAPERPQEKVEPKTEEEIVAHRILLRAQAVWDRLRDVDSALADPARLWEVLRQRWTEDDDTKPSMNVIVRHATSLWRVLNELDKNPRRILRRTHQEIPLSRVQEIDRRSMNWLVRQPGESLAQRAGDRQRVLAVAREENVDTLENRVLRSYAELARYIARDYVERNKKKHATSRVRKVREYGRRCMQISRDLGDRGVRLAERGVTPNYVLQQNANYQKIWDAWQELLKHDRTIDDLWKWQARSWEEFCALIVMVAFSGLPGSKLIASAPLSFLDEQRRGSWIDHDNPLGAFYLSEEHIVAEVRYRMVNPGERLADFAAPIWIRTGRTGNVSGFLSNIPVWPIWDADGGLLSDEARELTEILRLGRQAKIAAGMVLRPCNHSDQSEIIEAENVLTATVGTGGSALWSGIDAVAKFLSSAVKLEVG